MTRRQVLTLGAEAGKAVAWAVLGAGVHAAAKMLAPQDGGNDKNAPKNQESARLALIREIERSLKRGEGARILKEGTPLEVYDLLFSPESPLRQFGQDVLRGTSLDPSSPSVYPLFPSVSVCIVNKPTDAHQDFPTYKPRIEILVHDNEHPTMLRDKRRRISIQGNGIVMASDKIISNAHVTKNFVGTPKGGVHTDPHGQDAGLLTLPPYAELTQEIAERMPQWKFMDDNDLHGTFVVVAGIDPDVSGDARGLKFFGGYLIRVTKELLKSTSMDRTFLNIDALVGEHILVGVPTGQTLPVQLSSLPFQRNVHMYASGLSGGPLIPLARADGAKTIAGLVKAAFIYWGNPGIHSNEQCCYEMLFIAPPSALSRLRESSKWETL